MSREGLLGKIREFIDVSESKLDYVAAMLDMSTNYYRHTGVQSVAPTGHLSRLRRDLTRARAARLGHRI